MAFTDFIRRSSIWGLLSPKKRQRSRDVRTGQRCLIEQLEVKQCLAVDLAAPFVDLVIPAVSDSPVIVELADKFDLGEITGTLVEFQTNADLPNPNIIVELADQEGVMPRTTPVTAENFLKYVRSGSYDQTIVHRSIESESIQGGGFSQPQGSSFDNHDPQRIAVAAAIPGEVGNPLTAGTIAMALADDSGIYGTDPQNIAGTAKGQWFFNTADNSQSLGGAYTAFGKIVGGGMTVVEEIAAAQSFLADDYYLGLPFADLPLWQLGDTGEVFKDDFVVIQRAGEVSESALLSFQVTASNPSVVSLSIMDGNLSILPVPGGSGEVVVTVTAVSVLDQTTATATFQIMLDPSVPDLQVIDASGSVHLGLDETNRLFAGDMPVRSDSAALVQGFRGWSFFEAERVEGINWLYGEHVDGAVHRFRCTEAWTFDLFNGIGNSGMLSIPVAGRGLPFQPNGGGLDLTKYSAAIEVHGNTALRQTSQGGLFADTVVLSKQGQPVQVHAGQQLQPVAAEVIDGGIKVLWFDRTAANYIIWNVGLDGLFSSESAPFSGESQADQELLLNFGVGS